MVKVVGIVSLKGGVGKTSVTASLGDAIASFGKKVLLVDGNLSAPNLGLHFNIIRPKKSLHHVLSREIEAKDAIHNLERFDIIPASLFARSDESVLKLRDRLSSVKKDYDVVLIDSSPTLGRETLGVMLASDEILVVTTPDHPTLSNTIQAVKVARARGTPISGLILNKVYSKDFEFSIDDIEDATGVPVLAVIPHDVNVLKAVSDFDTYVNYKPNSKGGQEFKKLAATLTGEKYTASKIRNFLGWVHPQKQDINRTIYYEEVFK